MNNRYVYFQPNKLDLKDTYGDCTIRALCKVLDMEWIDAFNFIIPFCREYQIPNPWNCKSEKRNEIFDDMGFEYHGISNKRGTKRPTVSEFAKAHPKGRYLANVANHVVAVVDGKYYDTWDSGSKSMYGWYQPKDKPTHNQKTDPVYYFA